MLPSKSVLILLRLYILEFIIIMILIKAGNSLKCRTDDGPSDGELKRVARSCMRKFGDVAFVQNSQQQQQQQSQIRYRQRSGNRDNYGYNYEDSEEADEDDFEDQYYNNYNNNNNNNRNYHRQQGGSSNNNNNNNERGGNIGGHNGGGYNRSRYSGNNNNNRSNSGTGNNNWNYSNQRNNMGNSPNNRGTNSNRNKNNNNQNSNSTDAACIVHCFFEEMHMLNNNNYPDRHKMLYVLTKDLRDRELRNFYTDTIQECFRYLETQKRRDICKFSRDLITCITEYAKGNCDDWNEFSMMFN